MQILGIKTRIFKEGEDLMEFILEYTPTLREGDVVVLTSKIVALSQKRVGSVKDKEKLIKERFVQNNRNTVGVAYSYP